MSKISELLALAELKKSRPQNRTSGEAAIRGYDAELGKLQVQHPSGAIVEGYPLKDRGLDEIGLAKDGFFT